MDFWPCTVPFKVNPCAPAAFVNGQLVLDSGNIHTIISRDLYVLKLFALTRVFQIAVKAGGIPPVRESEILLGGGDIFTG